MIQPKEKFIVDSSGNKTAVLIDIADYNKILEELEELESIRAYDDAKASDDEAIPFEQAIKEIEQKRQ
jgi:PHD/YefM family antitoxin component YafN of YafNO toxin-antitoxin module